MKARIRNLIFAISIVWTAPAYSTDGGYISNVYIPPPPIDVRQPRVIFGGPPGYAPRPRRDYRGGGQDVSRPLPPLMEGFKGIDVDREFVDRITPGMMKRADAIQQRLIIRKRNAYLESLDAYAQVLDRVVSLESARQVADQLVQDSLKAIAGMNEKLESLPKYAQYAARVAQERRDRTGGGHVALDRGKQIQDLSKVAEQFTEGTLKEVTKGIDKGLGKGLPVLSIVQDVTDAAGAALVITKVNDVVDDDMEGLQAALDRRYSLKDQIDENLRRCRADSWRLLPQLVELRADFMYWLKQPDLPNRNAP